MFTLEEMLGINEFDQSPWTNWANQASEFSWLDASLMSGWSMDDFNIANGHATGQLNANGYNDGTSASAGGNGSGYAIRPEGNGRDQVQVPALHHIQQSQQQQRQPQQQQPQQQQPQQIQPAQQLSGNANGNSMLTDGYGGVETAAGTPTSFWRGEG